jgi:hypothetical protein
MRALQVSLRAVLGVVALAPWLWLALFAWLLVAATLHLGRLPRYNNPDPKHLVEVAWLYGMTSWLLVPIGLTPIAVSACLAIRSFVNPISAMRAGCWWSTAWDMRWPQPSCSATCWV